MKNNDRLADYFARRAHGLAATVAVILPVMICSIPKEHEWHVCKPGGSQTWICPGRGAGAIEHATREAAPFGAVRDGTQ